MVTVFKWSSNTVYFNEIRGREGSKCCRYVELLQYGMSPEINCSSLCAHLAVQTSFLTFKNLKINIGSLFSLLIDANYTLLKHCYQSSPVIGVCVHWFSVSACCTGIIINSLYPDCLEQPLDAPSTLRVADQVQQTGADWLTCQSTE